VSSRRRSSRGERGGRRKPAGLPFLSLLADACADARIPVPLPESKPPVTGIHLGLTPESTFVAPRSELLSLSSVLPPSDEVEEREQPTRCLRPKLPPLADDKRDAPRPRKRRRRVDPCAPMASAGGAGSDGDLPAPQISARRRREIARRRYQPPVDEQTDWDPAPPAAMEAQARQERAPQPTRAVSLAHARRAEKIFEAAIAAYVRGDLESAAADAMLARVFDPTHDGYARAELDWTDELRAPGRRASGASLTGDTTSSTTPRRLRRPDAILSVEAP
jgi:hypothetical protein